MASIRKRGETFTVTAYMGYDKEGRQIKKTTTYRPPDGVTAGKAEKLAKQFAAVWEEKIKGFVALDENRTFEELTKWYYESVAPVALKGNILIDNKTMIYTYVMPTLARKKLKDITPAMLDTLFTDLLQNGRVKDTYKLKDGCTLPKGRLSGISISSISRDTKLSRHTVTRLSQGHGIEKENAEKIADCLGVKFDDFFETAVEDRGLAESSVSRIKRCLSAIFTAAVKKEIMRRNPCSNTISLKKKSKAPATFLDETQTLNLIAALDEQNDFQFKVQINALLYTGMRGGELCGLQWSDIDLENGVIYIKHTLAYMRGKGEGKQSIYELQSPKTENSERYIVIPASLLDLLKQQKEFQEQRKAAARESWENSDMVFTTAFGGFYGEQYLNAKFKKFAKKIGLPESIHIHSLRHTTASLLINSDVSPKLIAEQLGHSSPSITLDIYSHIFATSKARAAQALEMKLNPKAEQ